LGEVLHTHDTLRVQTGDDEFVEIRRLPKLNRLTRVEGQLPEG
jgi:hypothetical protein